MLASQITVKTLGSYLACSDAIESIKNDYTNYLGGMKAWNSGFTVHMKQGAKDKIAAIERRMDTKFSSDCDEE